MSAMNMPGFTGEVSLGKTATIYRGGAGFGRSASDARYSVLPALFACGSQRCACAGTDSCI